MESFRAIPNHAPVSHLSLEAVKVGFGQGLIQDLLLDSRLPLDHSRRRHLHLPEWWIQYLD